MKTSKEKLLSIHGKNSCPSFNDAISEILMNELLTPEAKLFDIDKYYVKKISECNKEQLALLKSIGIEPQVEKWSRDEVNKEETTYQLFIEGGNFNWAYSGNKTPKCYRFENVGIARQESRIHELMLLMRNWARFHNEIDNYTPSWKIGNIMNHGIRIVRERPETDGYEVLNAFLFQIAVSSRQRADEMLKEFKSDIELIIPYL